MSETAGIIGLTERVRAEIHQHVFGHPDREVGGVLVGQRIDERAVQVRGMIPALEAVGQATAVTFTHKAWEVVHSELDRRFPEMQIVGWYHSHPGFGIFLSRDDLFIHESFFSKPWQFAYVIDPIGLEEGEFGWSGDSVVLLETRPISAPSGFRAPASKKRQTVSAAAEPLAETAVLGSAATGGATSSHELSSGRRYPLAGILAPLALGAVLGFLLAAPLGIGDEQSGKQAATPTAKKARAGAPAQAASDPGPSRARRPAPKPLPNRAPVPIYKSSATTPASKTPVEKELPEYESTSPPVTSEAAPSSPEVEVESGATVAPESGGVEPHFPDD